MHWNRGTAVSTGSACGRCLGSSIPAQALTVLLVGCQLLKQVCPVLLLLLHLRRGGVSLGLPLLQCCGRETLKVRHAQPRVRLFHPAVQQLPLLERLSACTRQDITAASTASCGAYAHGDSVQEIRSAALWLTNLAQGLQHG